VADGMAGSVAGGVAGSTAVGVRGSTLGVPGSVVAGGGSAVVVGVSAPAIASIGASSTTVSSSVLRRAVSRVARQVKAMRWIAVRFDRMASAHSAGSSRSSSAPAIRQIMRSGRSIMPTVHRTPIDSARAFV
jgi:hypothetical protein